MAGELGDLRRKLDEVDDRIIEALAQRQEFVNEVAERKAASAGALRDMLREQDSLTRLVGKARDAKIDSYFVTQLFREIFDHSVRRQQGQLTARQQPAAEGTLVVGYHGIEGSYSHLAAIKHFGPRDVELACRGFNGFRDMLEAVQAGDVGCAVLPIENTTAGTINSAYDLLSKMNLALIGEEILRVEHCLLAVEQVPLGRIRRIYSHPEALTQCSEFLSRLEHCRQESFVDTAGAARKVRDEQDLAQAAIASEDAARIYGLHIIKRDLANQRENYTRFVVVAKEPVSYAAQIPCKTSLIFATRHEEGALLACLGILGTHHLNLTKLESRPRPNNPWEYLFYVDFEGNIGQEPVQKALRELSARTSFFKVLGSYPARTTSRPAEPRSGPAPREADEAPLPEERPVVSASVRELLEQKPYKLASRAQRGEDTLVHVGSVTIGGTRPVIIAGPCAVESPEQIMACAHAVKDHGGDILRGGCFKPRTSPYSFQGLGYDGLDMLAEAGQAVGLPIITEVIHPSDVERVARKSDILQIGARNMQNYALLKEVGRVDRPVLLKRGMVATIDEWLAAAEYILVQGNQQVILCERGIRTFETATRNTLDLSAVPVARELVHLPIIVDPSHACGTWRWVVPMSRAALAAGAHGVMIEIHPDPDKARSDGPQSLTFARFEELMGQLRR
ncbi:MAG: bifunctional 3-deoxy-7-phosphoheptulonate synthase/chorismate mutase [Phycisphaerae bacterium]|nr:bifunctional 3-deoxy-7-phosphoheptulonate synthase/chorismate mutase [Phycisphaerae bacterium]